MYGRGGGGASGGGFGGRGPHLHRGGDRMFDRDRHRPFAGGGGGENGNQWGGFGNNPGGGPGGGGGASGPREFPRGIGRGVCIGWTQTGKCSYGDRCRFFHEPRPESMPPPESASRPDHPGPGPGPGSGPGPGPGPGPVGGSRHDGDWDRSVLTSIFYFALATHPPVCLRFVRYLDSKC
ncbi:hypothetical protein BSKO_10970 [Bryopsis sp. KO-2023]|nr:hypothetical protein BSKO_10970 [Bryopsis sp. KO-2023]